jgi:hypothetical protein
MKLFVVGSTGRTGLLLTEQALCRLEPLKTVGRLPESAGFLPWNSRAEAATPRFRLVNARERPFDPTILIGSKRHPGCTRAYP